MNAPPPAPAPPPESPPASPPASPPPAPPERTVRLVLVAPAMSAAQREARFDDGSAVESGSADPVCLGRSVRVLSSPSPRCRGTAQLLGLTVVEEPAALAGCAMGRWRGRRLDELAAEEPESVAAWLSDPDAAPHGGESLRELRVRVTGWLEGLEPGTVWAVAEPDVIRAAVAHALGAPEAAFWRLDVRPRSSVELTGRAGRWNVGIGSVRD
ncbi:histidine phosphatase family protein [Streptomyces narbonensis]|uniref:Histidine phosphatase family protein n=1 Tax=Streptomyces narbonensis TaxID=67333 RepID=A0ABV3C7E5_9ACTN